MESIIGGLCCIPKPQNQCLSIIVYEYPIMIFRLTPAKMFTDVRVRLTCARALVCELVFVLVPVHTEFTSVAAVYTWLHLFFRNRN